EQLGTGEPVEEPHAVGKDAELTFACLGVGPEVPAVDADAAGIGAQQAGGHRQCGGLTSTVRADEAVEAALGHVQVDTAHGVLLPEGFPQPAIGDRGVRVSRRGRGGPAGRAGVIARPGPGGSGRIYRRVTGLLPVLRWHRVLLWRRPVLLRRHLFANGALLRALAGRRRSVRLRHTATLWICAEAGHHSRG